MISSRKSLKLTMSPLNRNFLRTFLPQKPLPRDKQEKFLAHANIKVPEEQEQAYRRLLTKHHNVFSTDKNDLGWANHFEHKITP